MFLTTPENIIGILNAFNPWWRTGMVHKELTKPYRRGAYYQVLYQLEHPDLRRAVILTGARRVGKTTIQYQLIEHLLKKGVDPKKILFISFDHPLLKLSNFNDILDAYHLNVYGDEDVYYFFDEVQYASDWDLWVKTIYDLKPLAQIVATGSASPVLAKKATESGVGRWVVYKIPTMSFYEYCELIKVKKPSLAPEVKPTAFSDYNQRQWTQIMVQLSDLEKHFTRYLRVGGFPELALSRDDFFVQTVMREDIVDKVIKRDIPALYKIRNSAELEKVFLYLCYCSSNIISIETISKELGSVSRSTVNNYIQYLESANLIYRSLPVDLAGKKILKARAKIYVADSAIRNAVLMKEEPITDPEEMGIMVETAVYKHLAASFYKTATQIGYWRGGKKGKEVDVVVDSPKGRILVEVKYRTQAVIGEDDAIYKLAEHADSSFVVTKRADDYGVVKAGNKKIVRMPAFAFLYLLGHAEKQGAVFAV